jgi:hypothetical protein
MDSKVVHSHVQDVNDEQNSQNIESYPGMIITHIRIWVMSKLKFKMVSESIHDSLGHFVGPPAIRFLIGPSTIYIRAASPIALGARGCVKEVPHRLRQGLNKCL